VAENLENLNIFKGAPGCFMDALPLFSGLPAAALPVRAETAGAAQLFTVAGVSEGGQQALAAFTAEELLNPPLVRQGLAEAAVLFFHAPAHELFIFNPRHPQSRFETAPLRASRRDLSLLAGFLKTAAKSSAGDPLRLADGELSLGNLHGAHYLYALAAARNPASRARFSMCSAMIELGLLQEAYDLLKAEGDPEARLLLAVILRKTGSHDPARKMLAEVGTGTPMEDRRAAEAAWLDLEEGREEEAQKAFQKISSSAFDKTEALSGLGAALAKTAFKTKDKGRLSAAAAALRSGLVTPSPLSGRIFFQLGNLYFRSGDPAQAEACYRRSAALAPAVQALANLALTLIKTGKQAEAAAVTAQVALTDLPSASRLAAEFPPQQQAELFKAPQQPAQAQTPAPSVAVIRPARPAPETPPAFPPAPSRPGPQFPAPQEPPAPSGGLDSAGSGFRFIQPGAPAQEQNLLAPAQPRDASVSGRTRAAPAPARAEIKIETFRDTMAGSAPSEEESRKDDFISRAFRLASDLEDELGRKVYFNLDGLSEVEKRLRLQFIKSKGNPQGNIETVRSCAAFLCYYLQERHKGRLLKFTDFDPWGWPMVFELPGLKFSTYPVQRTWRLLWEETIPEPGWLTKYANWVADKLKETTPPPSGAAAAKAKVMSPAERLTDVQTEHKRMLVLISSLGETSHIELGRSGLIKLETFLKRSFKPDIPPTADGWKLLRCYGHLFAAILARDFKAAWYNVDGEDGGWSMQLPWKTLVFPLGKIYKTASTGDSLDSFYEALLAEKLKYQ
jgi:tetratricopeptide (TPR) repeat protein